MKNKVLNVVSALFGLLLLNGGLNKFLNYMPVPADLPQELIKDSMAIMEISWLMPLVGFAEIVGGMMILFPKTRALGALIVFPVMVGVLLTHITVAPEGMPIAIVIWIILSWIIWENRKKYLALLN
ncbi:MAG TPA: DoxX family membrane protein [Flavobacteriales bacterium]|nr:DoxX family protein [Flavobacteriales bacterium]HRE75697.1 DoxX family membrane protein [Flavobacteriales bacterium]HRE97650.1 DoxX family membrane protein [Flavobacteriales bacterium]HRJ34377.1 DoxX family membrane protein [Flavobacteriales bacterium]HRJ39704.1 DoxX family membrane protein [Flavobacteriales bacterium]